MPPKIQSRNILILQEEVQEKVIVSDFQPIDIYGIIG